MSAQDAVINHLSQRMTIVCRQRRRPVRAEPNTAVHIASTTGSESQARKASDTHSNIRKRVERRAHPTLESSCVHGENHGKRERQLEWAGVVA